MQGKFAVVTGGNAGIGLQIVRGLSSDGVNVIFGARDVRRNQEVQKSMTAQKGKVTSYKLDLSSFDSVKEFAAHVSKQIPKLDLLVNNAGVMAIPQRRLSTEGYEMQFAVNHLGHFLLSTLLFDKIRGAPEGRIINLSSSAHQQASRIDIPNLPKAEVYDNIDRYFETKLCNVLFITRLHALCKDKIPNLTFYAVHPGVVDTNLFEESALAKCFRACCGCCFKTPAQGAVSALHCCREEVKKLRSGEYYDSDASWKEMNPLGRQEKLQKQLWELSEKLLKLQFCPK